MSTFASSLSAFASALIGSGVVGFVANRLGTRWLDRAAHREQARFEEQIEVMRQEHEAHLAALERSAGFQSQVLSQSAAVIANGHLSSQERRISGIEEVWEHVVAMRALADRGLMVYNVLLPDEYSLPAMDSHRKLQHFVDPSAWEEFTKLDTKMRGIARNRPFVGEEVWLAFTVHSIFIGRRLLVLSSVFEKDGRIPNWTDALSGDADTGYERLLNLVLPDGELEAIKVSAPIGQPYRVLNAIEARILNGMSSVLSGEGVMHRGLDEYARAQDALARLDLA